MKSDCADNELCSQGRCVMNSSSDAATSDTAPVDTAPVDSAPADSAVREKQREKTKDSSPDKPLPPPDLRPKPCQGTPPPDCGTMGVCRGLKAKCHNNQWKCPYPSTYEQVETVCDGVDNDCDGQIDEGLVKDCYSGPAGTAGVAACKQGKMYCSAGTWGECKGEVLPSKELCDGKDNDCDGAVDELWKEKNTSCSVGIGSCKEDGKLVCSADGLGLKCNATPKAPLPEVCDNQDNDCNGKIDDNLSQTCYGGPAGTAGTGLCKTGIQTCNAGQWGACVGEVKPATEICDNKDNDCDGAVDEGLVKVCYTGPAQTRSTGLCKDGKQTCSAGQWGACVGEVKPAVEICDNKDNDCDGAVDEGLTRKCYSGAAATRNVGLCKEGSQTCSTGQWGTCVGEVNPTKEDCNGKDEDCDGQVDNGSNICGRISLTCQQGKCVCDKSKGYYPYGLFCIKDGGNCPVNLRGKQVCLDGNTSAICDPFGKVGILQCGSFSGGKCIRNSVGLHGCTMPRNTYMKTTCMTLTTAYTPQKKWDAVVKPIGSSGTDAVAVFNHCLGGGRTKCGTVVSIGGFVTACLCGERQLTCRKFDGSTYTIYDPAYYEPLTGKCTSFFGNRFGCPSPTTLGNGCSKSYVNGYASYGC